MFNILNGLTVDAPSSLSYSRELFWSLNHLADSLWRIGLAITITPFGAAKIQLFVAPGGQFILLEAGSHLKPYQFSSVVQFYDCVAPFGAAKIELFVAPGGQIIPLEAGSHLKPYQFSSVQLFNFTIV